MTEMYLEMKNISKYFGGVKALKEVDFSLKKGEIHCLVGENGSGKSTLIKIISGVLKPEPGASIKIEGEEFSYLTSWQSLQRGIRVIYQDLSLFANLSVAENIAINQHLADGLTVNWTNIKEIASRAMKRIGLEIDLNRPVGDLSIADRQLVAISRALASNARLIIMDEPTASLTRAEVNQLFKVIREMQENGITTMFISHKLDEIMEIADKVTILRDGHKIGTYKGSELDDEKLSYLMTGEKISYDYQLPEIRGGREVLRVQNLSKKGQYTDLNLELKEGEIVGITGLLGSGRTEFALSLFGMNPPDCGEVYLDGKRLELRSKEEAIKAGIGYLPEDRLTQGLIMEQSIENNLILTVFNRLLSRLKLIDERKKEAYVQEWINKLQIKVPSLDKAVSSLSGGNQQRVVLAKWIATNPRVLILDEPTVGVDIAAKDSIYKIIHHLAREGMSLIIISDEIPEVYYNCHRVIIMREGKFVAEYGTKNISIKELSTKVNDTANA